MYERILLVFQESKNRAQMMNNLGDAGMHMYESSGLIQDLSQSICAYADAVRDNSINPDHSMSGSFLANLGLALLKRVEQLGEARRHFQSNSHINKPAQLNNLGMAFGERFQQQGDFADINSSVACHQAAVNLTHGDMDPSRRLTSLGAALSNRFEQRGDLADINHSITYHRTAVDLTPDGHKDKQGQLSNLGNALARRFSQLGDLADINHSITHHYAAVDLTPDGHPDKPGRLGNLAIALCNRFGQLGDLGDLNQAITHYHAVLDLTPDGHMNHPARLSHLDFADLNNSIMYYGHPDKPVWLGHLWSGFGLRYLRLNTPEDLQKLLHYTTLSACSPSGPASIRFNAAIIWAMLAHKHDPESVLNAYATAISLLPELAWLALSISDRHHRLLHAGLLVRDAAAAAIAACDPQKAVEWLEQGRSIIWGQFLGLRTPVDNLKQRHPKLAEQFISVSKHWKRDFHEIALQRNNILNQIRQQPGFEQFLFPKSLSYLSHAAQSGPVVILNISMFRCDGLIFLPDLEAVIHAELFTSSHAEDWSERLAIALGATGRAERSQTPTQSFVYILSELWTKIIQPILNAIAINSPEHHPDASAFLPIHAAGLYDFVISSYTPSLSALLEGHRMRSVPQTELQLLAVSQSSSNGQTYIPGTRKEAEYIQQEAHGKLHVLHIDELNATPDNVQEGMKVSSWAHFACHGVQHPTPTESALLLAGSSRLTLFDIIKLELPNADLAFLSACETATGSSELQDEAVHLTAGMLSAGYRSGIGTMWTIQDDDAPQVARDV
ncbi:CHAT domain-containing protein [Favolaschia claudopus]|uniref:CHAT domain-containing protein n=1 Tax=Favolaschia claudopus TaxID=2862362 RepID=A0AAV9ZL74_9AGAR